MRANLRPAIACWTLASALWCASSDARAQEPRLIDQGSPTLLAQQRLPDIGPAEGRYPFPPHYPAVPPGNPSLPPPINRSLVQPSNPYPRLEANPQPQFAQPVEEGSRYQAIPNPPPVENRYSNPYPVSEYGPVNTPAPPPYSPYNPTVNPPPVDQRFRREETYRPPFERAVPPAWAPVPQVTTFEAGKVLAIVGDQYILAGDVLPQVDQLLEQYKDKAPKAQLDQQREMLVRQLTKQLVENKLLYLEFLKTIPTEKRGEAMPMITKKMYEEFEKEEFPQALKKAEVSTAAELEAKLRQYGSSLEKQRRAYMENKLGRMAIGQNVKVNPEVTFEEKLKYYREHIADYQVLARARWQQLSAYNDRFNGSSDQARQAINIMYREVYLGGAPFDAVARRSSQEPRAAEGGLYDWTNKGSLISEPIDAMVFSQEVGKLGVPFEDERGWHIVRVLERQEATTVPFTKAQTEIEERLKKDKVRKGVVEYITKVRQRAPIWTVFDGEKDSLLSPASPGPGPTR